MFKKISIDGLLKPFTNAENRDRIKDLKARAASKKPDLNYDSRMEKSKDYHERKMAKHIKAAIEKRYKQTGKFHSVCPINIIRPSAEMASQGYEQEPRRLISNEALQPLLDKAVKLAQLDLVMPEMEHQLMTAKTIFCRLSWSEPFHAPKEKEIKLEVFWPNEVHVVTDKKHPTSLGSCSALVADIGDSNTEVWTRFYDEDLEQFMWNIDRYTVKGENYFSTVYRSNLLPWAVFNVGKPKFGLYSLDDPDSMEVQDTVSSSMSNWLYKDDLQGHKQLVVSGQMGTKAGTELVSGPGALWNFPGGATVSEIGSDHDMTTLEGAKQIMLLYAHSQRLNADAWKLDDGAPLSGQSRKIKNIQSDKKRAENIKSFMKTETTQLIPIIVDIWNIYSDEFINPEFDYDCVFPEMPEYEDPEYKRVRVSGLMREGLITPARAAVMLKLYRKIEDAIEDGISNDFLPISAEAPKSRATSPQSEAPPDVSGSNLEGVQE